MSLKSHSILAIKQKDFNNFLCVLFEDCAIKFENIDQYRNEIFYFYN